MTFEIIATLGVAGSVFLGFIIAFLRGQTAERRKRKAKTLDTIKRRDKARRDIEQEADDALVDRLTRR